MRGWIHAVYVLQCLLLVIGVHWGKCPQLLTRQEFNIVPYQGVWYMQGGYNHDGVNQKINCFAENYTYLYETAGLSKVERSWVDIKKNKTHERIGCINQVDPNKIDGVFVESFDDTSCSSKTKPYWILDTDFISYSVVYACKPVMKFWHEYSIMLLSRHSTFPHQQAEDWFWDQTTQVLHDNGLRARVLKSANQVNCTIPS